MHDLVKISEKAEKEIGKIAEKPTLSLSDIEAACKAVDLMKKIEETMAIRNENSMMNEDDMYGYGRSSYGYGEGTHRYGKRYMRGSESRNYSTGQNAYRGIDYAYASEKDQMVDKLESMMTSSGNEQYRQIIAECVDRINRSSN